MYEIPIYRVALVKESAVSSSSKVSVSVGSLATILRKVFAGLDREHFKVVMLDGKNRIIGINTVSIGTLNRADVYPREVFKPAVICNAASIILSHNHPAGDPQPSEEDKKLTILMEMVGEQLGIKVLDHIIIGGGKDYFSFAKDKVEREKREKEQRDHKYICKALERQKKGKASFCDLMELLKFKIKNYYSGDDAEGAWRTLNVIVDDLKLFLDRRCVSLSLKKEAESWLGLADSMVKKGIDNA